MAEFSMISDGVVDYYVKDKKAREKLGSVAPIDSPTFTGTPKVPTAEKDSNDEQIASTEFVQGKLSDMKDNIYEELSKKADKLTDIEEDDILLADDKGGFKNSGKKISDLSSFEITSIEPSNKKMLWIDTSSGGVIKYHNGTEWVPTLAVWG